MFKVLKPEPVLKVEEPRLDFFEEEVEPTEKPRVRFLFEVKRNHSA